MASVAILKIQSSSKCLLESYPDGPARFNKLELSLLMLASSDTEI